jgi:hypothetical protein
VQGGRVDVDGWVADTAWIQLARVVRLLAAALLLGVALLLMVVLGQGIAAAGEQATAPGDAADGDVLPAETTGDGPATGQVAGADVSETGDGVYHDFTEATTAANAVLAQSVTPLPQDAPPDPHAPEPTPRQPESWGEGYRPKEPQEARQELVEEDGRAEPDQRGEASGRGVDIMLGPNDVYLAIGAKDQPDAPYTGAVPAEASDDPATSAKPQPAGSDPAAGLVYDLDALEQAGASFGPLNQYPRDHQGVVQLPAVTVTAKPITEPDEAPSVPVAVVATPAAGEAQRDSIGPVGDGTAGGHAGWVEVTGSDTSPMALADAGRRPAGAAGASRIPEVQPWAPARPGPAGRVPAELPATALPPAAGPRRPDPGARGLADIAQSGMGSPAVGVLAARPVTEQGTGAALAGPAPAGSSSTISRVLRALGGVVTPASAAAAVTAAPTGSFASAPESATSATADATDREAWDEYYIEAGVYGFVAAVVSGAITAAVLADIFTPLVLLTTVLDLAPYPAASVGAVLAMQLFFRGYPPRTDAEWSAQRFWTTTALGVSVALTTLPIVLVALPVVSVLGAVGLSVLAGGIAAALDYVVWPAVSPPPSSLPEPPQYRRSLSPPFMTYP